MTYQIHMTSAFDPPCLNWGREGVIRSMTPYLTHQTPSELLSPLPCSRTVYFPASSIWVVSRFNHLTNSSPWCDSRCQLSQGIGWRCADVLGTISSKHTHCCITVVPARDLSRTIVLLRRSAFYIALSDTEDITILLCFEVRALVESRWRWYLLLSNDELAHHLLHASDCHKMTTTKKKALSPKIETSTSNLVYKFISNSS
jgi:hypothetical protein